MLKPGSTYHVFNRGNNGEVLYNGEAGYRGFLSLCRKYILPVAKVHAWCLMPNHFHLLVKIRTEQEQYLYYCQHQRATETSMPYRKRTPSRRFATAFSQYALDVNRDFGRTGSLFQDGFRRKEVLTDNYLRFLVNYIHFNPIKHRFVSDASDYYWSSLPAYMGARPNDYLDSKLTDIFVDLKEYQAQ